MSERHIHPLCLVLDYRCVLCLVWSVKYLPTFTTILSMITSFYVFMQEAREPDRLFCHWEDINTGSTFMNGAAQDGTTLRCRTTHTLLTLPVGRSLCATPSWVFWFFFVSMTKCFFMQPLARESACGSLLSLLPAYLSTDTNMLEGNEDLRVVSLWRRRRRRMSRVTQQCWEVE